MLTAPTRAGLLGAILGDFVKGPLAGRYEPELERAIALHRAIDRFTDTHPAVRASVARVSPARRRYAGIMIDIFFDHFLVRHWPRYGAEPLDPLVERTYALLTEEAQRLPPRLQGIAPRMIAQDWLRSYGQRHIVGLTLQRMSTRLSKGDPLATGMAEFDAQEGGFESDFHAFIPDAVQFARAQRAHWQTADALAGSDLRE